MTPAQIIVIGGSAGAIPSILEIVRNLPVTFVTPIGIVVHIHSESKSVLPQLLESASGIVARHAVDGLKLEPRRIYVAPPGMHMLIEEDHIRLHEGAEENRNRPAIDPLFRSAAGAFGSNAIAVLLSGFLDDGTAGLLAIKREGGRIIVQDPSDTPFGDMPTHALEFVDADFVLTVGEIPMVLQQLTTELASRRPGLLPSEPSLDPGAENLMSDVGLGDWETSMQGQPSPLVCPQCSGPLWEIEDDRLVRYRCHEGHAFAPQSLIVSQNEALEKALWTALRALDDKITLHKRLLERAENQNQFLAANKFRRTLESTYEQTRHIRAILKRSSYLRNPSPTGGPLEKELEDDALRE